MRALDLKDSSRISILSIKGGSIIIEFSIAAPTDTSDLIAAQIQALLELQLDNPNSMLLSGIVTSLINTQRTLPLLVFMSEAKSSIVEIDGILTVKDDVTGLPLPTQPPIEEEETVNIQVADYREAGSFQFGNRHYNVAEITKYVVIDVIRDHGSKGTVEVDYYSISGTANGNGTDYSEVNGTLTFKPHETNAYISIPIEDDIIIEQHLGNKNHIIIITIIIIIIIFFFLPISSSFSSFFSFRNKKKTFISN
jgi:hypothetical protein